MHVRSRRRVLSSIAQLFAFYITNNVSIEALVLRYHGRCALGLNGNHDSRIPPARSVLHSKFQMHGTLSRSGSEQSYLAETVVIG